VLRRATLDELGGAQAIVRAHLGAAVGALSPAERDVAARVFNHLVTPSGTKIAHGAGDLAQYAAVDEAELLPVLESLGRDRIVRPVDGRFEIFHDVLADAVSAWRTRHEAERALQRQRAEAERRHRRLLLLLASTLTALAVVAVIAIYALTQRSAAREQAGRARAEATTARANALATQASLLVPITAVAADPQLGLLLAAEAARLSPGGRTADLLRRALLVSHLRAVLPERGVTSASFSPDGTRIAVGSRRGTASVYTGDARRRLRTLRLGNVARTVAFAPGGRRLLTTERDGPARIWDARRGVQLHALGLSPTEASFSADGRLVMTVDAGRARIWNAADGSKVAALRQPDAVRHASFAPRGARVVTVGTGSVARIFDARSGARVAAVDQGGPITSATLTPRGGLLTTGGNLPPRIWTLRRSGPLVRVLPGAGNVTAGVVAPDGDLLVTVSTDGVPRAWELGSGRLVADLVGHTNRVAGAGFSRDSRSVVTWSSDGTALVWDPARGSARVALAGHGDAVTDAAFDRSGDAVLTTSADGRARLWSSRVGADLEDVVTEIAKPIRAATFSDDGRTVAAAGPSATRVLRARDGQDLARVPARRVGALALSRDGSLLATAELERVAVWRAATGERVGPESATATAAATALAFSPDARRLAIGKRDGSILVSTPGTVRTARLTGGRRAVSSLAFAPSGATLAAGFADGTVAAWNVRDRRRILRVRAHRPGTAVRAIAFGPGGQRLVTTGDDSAVRIWDVAAGRPAYTLHGHYGTVRDAAFSPDGRWLVTAGPSAAGLWDLSTRERLLFIRSREGQGRVLAVAFDASGRRGATVAADGTLRAFRCDVCADIPELRRLAARATAATGRRLSARERRRYLGG